MKLSRFLSVFLPLLLTSSLGAAPAEPRWWKGNLHTHSLWSDGDGFPDMITAWYKDHGYQFLAISDHNVLGQGQRWMLLADGLLPVGVPGTVGGVVSAADSTVMLSDAWLLALVLFAASVASTV